MFDRLTHEFTGVRCAALDGLLVTPRSGRPGCGGSPAVEASSAAVKAEI
jgi:hypothetical protein